MSSTTLTSLAVAAPRIPATARRTFRRAAATPAPRRGDGIARRAAETSYENSTIDLELSTEEARATLQFDKVVVNEEEGPVIFVTGRGRGAGRCSRVSLTLDLFRTQLSHSSRTTRRACENECVNECVRCS